MKKLLFHLFMLFGLATAAPALAANCSSYPYTLTNGTTADANQVMANFNGILTCANTNLAHNGANSDITSLSGLTTPLALNVGGTAATTASGARTNLGLGTAATQNTGTSGANVPLLNGANSWSAMQTAILSQSGSSTWPLLLQNGNPAASSGVGISLDPIGNGVGSRDAEIYATTNGANQITLHFATANSAAPADVLTLGPSGTPTVANAAGWRSAIGVTATGSDTTYAYRANNLSDLASASTARTNLGLGTAATQNTGTSGATVPLLNGANTWSATQTVAGSASGTAVTALGLRNTAGTASSSVLIDFDASGNGTGSRSAQVQAVLDSSGNGSGLWLRPGVNGVGATTAMQLNSNLSVTLNGYSAGTLVTDASGNVTAASAATERTNLGVTATGSDTTYAYRANNLSDLANAATARTNLGLGSIATQASSSVSITGGAISGLTSLANTGDSTLGDANADTATVNGHLQSAGTAPTVSSCGTGASVGSNSNDNRGSFTTGTGTVNSCVLTFSRAWAVAPFCVISPFQTTPTIEAGLNAFSTTSVTFTFNPNGASTAFMYHCEG